MLSVLTQVFMIVSMVGVVWVLYGYSLAFGDGGSYTAYIGGFGKAFLSGITPDSNVPDLLERCRHSGIRLHGVPDDVCDDHPGAHRGLVRRADEVLCDRLVHVALGHADLFPHRALGLGIRGS